MYGTTGWIWDAMARDAYDHHQQKDLLLALIPAGFVCFTDFMTHVLDKEYRYTDSPLFYNGLFTILCVLIVLAALLPFSFVALASEKSIFLANFDNSWPLAKWLVKAAFLFEAGLGVTEAIREVLRDSKE